MGRASLADGYLDNCVIECPKHNGRFDVRTGRGGPPAGGQVPGYLPCAVRDGRLVVALEPPEDQAEDQPNRPARPSFLLTGPSEASMVNVYRNHWPLQTGRTE